MTRPLERPLPATVWELRAAWASRREVILRFDDRAAFPRVRGRVRHVAASGVFVQIDDGRVDAVDDRGRKLGPVHVPTAIILSVRTPHFTEPLDAAPARREDEDALAGQTSIYDFIEEDPQQCWAHV